MKSIGEIFRCSGPIAAIVACAAWYAQNPGVLQWPSLSTRPPPSTDCVVAIDFSGDGRQLLSLSRGDSEEADRLVLLRHDLETRDRGSILAAPGFERGVLSFDGTHAAVGSIYGNLWWIDLESGEPQPLIEPLSQTSVRAVAIAHGTGQVAAATVDSQQRARVYLCDAARETVTQMSDVPQGDVSTLRFSEDGRRLLFAGSRGVLAIWDLWALGPPIVLPENGRPIGADFLGHGERVVSATSDGMLRIREVASGREEWQWKVDWGNAGIRALAASPDGTKIAWCGFSRRIAIGDATKRRKTHEIGVPTSHVSRLRFSPDGKMLAVAGAESVIRLYDIRTGAELRTFDARE